MWPPYAVTVFTINNAASKLGGGPTLLFINTRGQHPLLPLCLPDLRSAGDSESQSAYGVRMTRKAFEH